MLYIYTYYTWVYGSISHSFLFYFRYLKHTWDTLGSACWVRWLFTQITFRLLYNFAYLLSIINAWLLLLLLLFVLLIWGTAHRFKNCYTFSCVRDSKIFSLILYIFFIIVCGEKNEFMYFKLTSLRALAQANCCVTNVAEDLFGMLKLLSRRYAF